MLSAEHTGARVGRDGRERTVDAGAVSQALRARPDDFDGVDAADDTCRNPVQVRRGIIEASPRRRPRDREIARVRLPVRDG
jgi:hypothetical protein